MSVAATSNRTAAHRASLRFIDCLVPSLVTAGQYALSLQGRLRHRAEPKTGDAWQSALTDADIGVQQFIEAVVLAKLPGWDFYGEEHAATSNTPYFPTGADACVMLDPINGTRLYRDNSPWFDLLVSLRWRGSIIATLSYHPALSRLYGSSLFAPSFVLTGADLRNAEPLEVVTQEAAPLGVYQCPPRLIDAVAAIQPIFDFSADYDPSDSRCALNSLFTGQLSGYLMLDCALLDVGATAFAVTRLGGKATRPDGTSLNAFDQFDPERRADLLVTRTPALHEALVESIQRSGAYG
ncbi:MAG: inositol monophosphatase family protein [Pseudomonadota bacterium]